MSKGSTQRPQDKERFDREFDRIFRKPNAEVPPHIAKKQRQDAEDAIYSMSPVEQESAQ